MLQYIWSSIIIITGAVVSFGREEYVVMESGGKTEVSLLRSGKTDQETVVMVQSRALESTATGLLSGLLK